jgi:hypothetical protein
MKRRDALSFEVPRANNISRILKSKKKKDKAIPVAGHGSP